MSFMEKQEGSSKDKWVTDIGSHVQRVSMNNLIMNYLVTGKINKTSVKVNTWIILN